MIAPFNFPLNLAAHKIAPAIAVGCPWVLKPASRTPLGALMIAEILSRQSELPIGAFSVLPCQRDGADLFTTDERFKLLSFTGSPDVNLFFYIKKAKSIQIEEIGDEHFTATNNNNKQQQHIGWLGVEEERWQEEGIFTRIRLATS
jgi:delta 1-pyrroline-5-carboxylate dehydrogenase